MIQKEIKLLRVDVLVRERKGVKGKPRKVYNRTEYILYTQYTRTEGQIRTKIESIYPNWEVLAVDSVEKVSEVRVMSEEDFIKYSTIKTEREV